MIQTTVRNQDVILFFRGFATNPKAFNALRNFFEDNYDSVKIFHVSSLLLLLIRRILDLHTPRDHILDEVHR